VQVGPYHVGRIAPTGRRASLAAGDIFAQNLEFEPPFLGYRQVLFGGRQRRRSRFKPLAVAFVETGIGQALMQDTNLSLQRTDLGRQLFEGMLFMKAQAVRTTSAPRCASMSL
jgi:hypothetical protein